MKTITATALVLAQLAAAAPAAAADLAGPADATQTRLGAFAGGRLRVPLGGRQDRAARLGLTLAPYSQSRGIDGRTTLRYAEGVEFGLVGRQPAQLRLAGHRLASDGTLVDDSGRRLGVSTLGAAGIAAGVIVAGAIIAALAIRNDDD
jgi:hypothetical protein